MTPAPPPALGAGLCDRCRHQQIVATTRGSRFSLCRRSRDEPERYPRYPRLPVLACPGYAAGEGTGDRGPATGPGGDPGR